MNFIIGSSVMDICSTILETTKHSKIQSVQVFFFFFFVGVGERYCTVLPNPLGASFPSVPSGLVSSWWMLFAQKMRMISNDYFSLIFWLSVFFTALRGCRWWDSRMDRVFAEQISTGGARQRDVRIQYAEAEMRGVHVSQQCERKTHNWN